MVTAHVAYGRNGRNESDRGGEAKGRFFSTPGPLRLLAWARARRVAWQQTAARAQQVQQIPNTRPKSNRPLSLLLLRPEVLAAVAQRLAPVAENHILHSNTMAQALAAGRSAVLPCAQRAALAALPARPLAARRSVAARADPRVSPGRQYNENDDKMSSGASTSKDGSVFVDPAMPVRVLCGARASSGL